LLLECCKHAVLKFKQKDHGDMFSLYRCGGIPREISPYALRDTRSMEYFFREKKKIYTLTSTFHTVDLPVLQQYYLEPPNIFRVSGEIEIQQTLMSRDEI